MDRYLWGAAAAAFGQIAFIYWHFWSPLGAGPAFVFLHLLQYAGIGAGAAALFLLARAVGRQAGGRRAIRMLAAVAMGLSAAATLLIVAAMVLRGMQRPIHGDVFAFAYAAAKLTWLLLLGLGLLALGARPRPVLPAIVLGVVFLAGVAVDIPLPYRLTGPAGEPDTSYLVRVEGGEPHPDRIYGLTLWAGTATLADYLVSLVSRYTVLVPLSASPALADEDAALSQMLTDSEAMAKAVGLQLLGRGKGATPSGAGAVVTAVRTGTPAAGLFQTGDLIVAMDGAPVTNWAGVLERLQALGPGAKVTFSIRRDGEPRNLSLTTAPNPAAPEKAMVGIQGGDQVAYDIPVPIATNIPTEVGGPSMGLALTLQVIDQATPGGITNGWRVAATGQILPDGEVGPVGGLRYKVPGAERAGAGVIFVPRLNYEEALSAATEIQVVPVDSAQQALDWLKAHPKK